MKQKRNDLTRMISLLCLSIILLISISSKAQKIPQIPKDTTCEMWYFLSLSERDTLKAFYESHRQLKKGTHLMQRFDNCIKNFMTIANKEYYYLPDHNLSFCDLRKNVLSPEFHDFFISTEDLTETNAIIEQFKTDLQDYQNIAPYSLKFATYLQQFISLSKQLHFSKLEIFHESTGYWCSSCYIHDSINPFDHSRLIQGSALSKTLVEMNKIVHGDSTSFGEGICLSKDGLNRPDRVKYPNICAQKHPFSYSMVKNSYLYTSSNLMERIKMLEIPEDTLKSLSDQEVVDLLLTYPLNGDFMITTNNLQNSMNYYFSISSIHKESLLRKEKIAQLLLDEYLKLPLDSFPNMISSEDRLAFLSRLNSIGTYLSKSEFLQALSKENIVKLKNGGCNKISQMQNHLKDFGTWAVTFYCLPLLSQLYNEGEISQDDALISFYKHEECSMNPSLVDDILHKTVETLKK